MTDINKVDPPLFPTMLRKMWSGREVQEWINENWDASTLTALQSENESHARARQYLLAENDTLRTQLAEAQAENKRLREALNELCAWGDGDLGNHMDEPYAAMVAREALQAKPVERKQMKCIHCGKPADFTHTCPQSRGDDIEGFPV